MNKLFLIPNSIGDNISGVIATFGLDAVKDLHLFFVEEPKSARRLLKSLWPDFHLQECSWFDLNEHTLPGKISKYAKLIEKNDSGIISEAGCPCVADPGSALVRMAHEQGIEIIPLIGPSSILLALMASGLNGQNFAFNGYLPKDNHERAAKIKFLEKRSALEWQTQIFMETPYRNQSIFDDLLIHLDAGTLLCMAWDITGQEQSIMLKTIKEWRKSNIQLPRKPALFIINHHKS